MQWDDLQRQMPRYDEYLAGNRTTRFADCSGKPPKPSSHCGWVAPIAGGDFFMEHVFQPVVWVLRTIVHV